MHWFVRACGSRRVVLYPGGVLNVVIITKPRTNGASDVVHGCPERCVEDKSKFVAQKDNFGVIISWATHFYVDT